MSYLSWAAAWAEVKKIYPDSTYQIYEETISYAPDGITPMKKRPWFDDGKTGWVKTGVIINGIEHIEQLPIMDYKNKPILAEAITSYDANKTIQRSLTKACARHGLGLYIYEGEELPEDIKELERLQDSVYKIIIDKAKLSAEAKEKVEKISKEADPTANGNPKLIDDIEILKELQKALLAIRK